ncbi:DJ1A, partial [Symbiodinium sp. KB8]
VACLTDVLTRAGADVTLASAEESLSMKLSGSLTVEADALLSDCLERDWAAIALPGGKEGAERLAENRPLISLLRKQRQAVRCIAAIGESPAEVLAGNDLLEFDEKATSLPTPRFKKVLDASCAGWWNAAVVVDRKVVTSQGPGTALPFALRVVELLYGRDK